MFFVFLLLLGFFTCAHSTSEVDILSQAVNQHRCSKAFQEYQPKHANIHPYYVFLEWWMDQKLTRPHLDPAGTLTQALLEHAVGFGGWSMARRASKEENTVYQNAAFFHYWDNKSATQPDPESVLGPMWRAAQEKQFLLKPYAWLPQEVTQPRNIGGWYNLLRDRGWSLRSHMADDAINSMFRCRDSSSFQDTVISYLIKHPPEGMSCWMDCSLMAARSEAVVFPDNPLEVALREKGSSANLKDVTYQVMCKQLSPCLQFWHLLSQTDLSSLDVNGDTALVRVMQLFLQSAYKRRNPKPASNQIEHSLFLNMLDDGVKKKLWKIKNKDFPRDLIAYGCLSDKDVNQEDEIYAKAWSKFHNKLNQYGQLNHPNEMTRLSADFLSYVLKANEINQYRVMTSGFIFGEFIPLGMLLDEEQNDLAERHLQAYQLIHKLKNDFLSRFQPNSVTNISYEIVGKQIKWKWYTNILRSSKLVDIPDDQRHLLESVGNICPEFSNNFPILFRDRYYLREHDPCYNIACDDDAKRLSNVSRSLDFLVQKGDFQSHDKWLMMLGLFRDGII